MRIYPQFKPFRGEASNVTKQIILRTRGLRQQSIPPHTWWTTGESKLYIICNIEGNGQMELYEGLAFVVAIALLGLIGYGLYRLSKPKQTEINANEELFGFDYLREMTFAEMPAAQRYKIKSLEGAQRWKDATRDAAGFDREVAEERLAEYIKVIEKIGNPIDSTYVADRITQISKSGQLQEEEEEEEVQRKINLEAREIKRAENLKRGDLLRASLAAKNEVARNKHEVASKKERAKNLKEVKRLRASIASKNEPNLKESQLLRESEFLLLSLSQIRQSREIRWVRHFEALSRLNAAIPVLVEVSQSLWLDNRARPETQPFGVSDSGAEALVASWLSYLGQKQVEVTQYSRDGGIDVSTSTCVCQVKNYTKANVSASEVRDIFGTAVSEGKIALIFTSSSLSADAKAFCDKNGIAAVSYSAPEGSLSPINSFGKDLLNAGRYE
jgi:hypothetical protein